MARTRLLDVLVTRATSARPSRSAGLLSQHIRVLLEEKLQRLTQQPALRDVCLRRERLQSLCGFDGDIPGSRSTNWPQTKSAPERG